MLWVRHRCRFLQDSITWDHELCSTWLISKDCLLIDRFIHFVAVPRCKVHTCSSNGSCRELQDGSTVCECEVGYSGDDCSEVLDFCLSAPCAQNSSCMSTTSGFDCICTDKESYTNGVCQEGIVGYKFMNQIQLFLFIYPMASSMVCQTNSK